MDKFSIKKTPYFRAFLGNFRFKFRTFHTFYEIYPLVQPYLVSSACPYRKGGIQSKHQYVVRRNMSTLFWMCYRSYILLWCLRILGVCQISFIFFCLCPNRGRNSKLTKIISQSLGLLKSGSNLLYVCIELSNYRCMVRRTLEFSWVFIDITGLAYFCHIFGSNYVVDSDSTVSPKWCCSITVSYTHLTLPTLCSV